MVFMPPTLDPVKLAKMQEISKHIKGKIEINYTTGCVSTTLVSEEAAAKELIPSLLEQFGSALAGQLSSVFAIKGEIVEVGKPEKSGKD